MQKDLRIRAANFADKQAVSDVFQNCGLPSSDVDHSTRLYHLAVHGDVVIGCACGEQYGRTIVVQSVAVLPEYREQQVAMNLVGALLIRASSNGCTKAVLLTADNPTFFTRYGFIPPSPDDMPQEVSMSKEFLRRFAARTHSLCSRLE
ncbi:GNAT family N-acetyltransferase [Cupriavidus sp. AcVe19-6a]|uniref:GNAT family N-acetyltransferase n=1 Tax=Cupriavidus sp. AcVe19-6a TaxID=2821358 RepID=UPI001AE0F71E|nr:GNAT family N-acetyltransferase [Cupriavidus sp. AcVe19-6a]MBP0637962.1 GNAT family N-acetyltransferase [Cupriavidus sp. AcVe19-6a]